MVNSIALLLLSVAGGLIIWAASGALILILLSIVIAVLFDAGARAVGSILPWSRKVRLVLTFVLLTAATAIAVYSSGAIILDQASQFVAASRTVFARMFRILSRSQTEGTVDLSQWLPSSEFIIGGATRVAMTSFGILTSIAAALFMAAFFSWEPEIYKAGFLSLLPASRRPRLDGVLDQTAEAMRQWIVGQTISMVLIFAFTLTTLMLIGMPYPILLAVLAGLLTFIPTIGPFIAGIVIVLAGLAQNLTMALYGLGAYLAVQFLESNLITPLVQERTVHLPPGLMLALQLIAGALFGLAGLTVAIPLAAAAKVLIGELYVEDRLGGAWLPNQNDMR